jgi:hypothetical protein
MLEILTLDQGGFCSIPAVRQISAGYRNHLHYLLLRTPGNQIEQMMDGRHPSSLPFILDDWSTLCNRIRQPAVGKNISSTKCFYARIAIQNLRFFRQSNEIQRRGEAMANGTFQKTVICGHIGADPVLRTTPDGTAVLNLSVATTHAWTNKETGKRETRTEWHRCIAFRNIADMLSLLVTLADDFIIACEFRKGVLVTLANGFGMCAQVEICNVSKW